MGKQKWTLYEDAICYIYFEKYGRVTLTTAEGSKLFDLMNWEPNRFSFDSIDKKFQNFNGNMSQISKQASEVKDILFMEDTNTLNNLESIIEKYFFNLANTSDAKLREYIKEDYNKQFREILNNL